MTNVLKILNDELKHAMLFAGTASLADIKYVLDCTCLLVYWWCSCRLISWWWLQWFVHSPRAAVALVSAAILHHSCNLPSVRCLFFAQWALLVKD